MSEELLNYVSQVYREDMYLRQEVAKLVASAEQTHAKQAEHGWRKCFCRLFKQKPSKRFSLYV